MGILFSHEFSFPGMIILTGDYVRSISFPKQDYVLLA